MSSLNEIRSQFLNYFAAADHAVIASSPLVPQDDPTLLFVNAGMVPFKNIFTGAESAPSPRATTSQKCVRAGGKHNDLDNVGYTARHLTFFEMLGNFSFGDYFKAEAIELAWNLITRGFDLPKDRLVVTVYAADEEAPVLWRKIAGIADDQIIRIATSDNFWAMGDTGPCGPCSEIFFDHGPSVAGGPPGSPDEDGDRFVEFWNLVFMQYNQGSDGVRVNLPKPSIDTGMGLERMTCVLQGVHSVFETDLFRTLIGASESAVGVKAEGENTASHRVIADHLRSMSFLIADGVTPSNEGRGYVLRRIMRRAMRHAFLLGAKDPLMHRLAPTLIDAMSQAFPELRRAEPLIIETLRSEEERFRATLGRGLALLDDATAGLRAGDTLAGETAFKLYDTYGFPLDLTQDAIRPRGIGVDLVAFNVAMDRQRTMARESWTGSGQQAQAGVWLALRERFGPTRFTGYDALEGSAEVLAMVRDGDDIPVATVGESVQVLFDTTPFYGESGGQAGDRGRLKWSGGAAEVTDVSRQAGDLHVHAVTVTHGHLERSSRIHLVVDASRRARTRLNHSAAHLAHAALRHVLGPHVAQKGQLVDGERMRFDFSHSGPLSSAELEAVESEVNRVIGQNLAAETEEMAPAAAIDAGAVALFGEKYGDRVRVLTLGRALDGEGAYSVELCGGTHAARTGDLALFKIVSETGIAAGIRRIEALTAEPARRYLLDQAAVAKALADQFKVPVSEVVARVDALDVQRRKLERDLADAKRQLAVGGGGGETAPEDIGGLKFIGRVLQGVGGKDLRPIAEAFKKQVPDGVIALCGVADGKVACTVAVTGSALDRFSAADLARTAVIAMGGQGAGGKSDFAQGGAPDGSRAAEGIAAIKAMLES